MFVEKLKKALLWLTGLAGIVAAALWSIKKSLPSKKGAPAEMPKVSEETAAEVVDAHAKADAIKIEAAAAVAATTDTLADIAKESDGKKRRKRLADLEKETD